MHLTARLKVEVTVRPTDAGGRRSPILSGYRGGLFVVTEDEIDGATIDLIGLNELGPGATGEAVIRPFHPEYWEHLQVGDNVAFREGRREVGTVKIVERL